MPNRFILTQDTSSLIILLHKSRQRSMPARKVSPNSPDRLTVTLDADDRAELDRLSAESDRSLAWIVREAIRQYLSRARDAAREKAG
jgi:Ribbon-helix-helix protein, copG family